MSALLPRRLRAPINRDKTRKDEIESTREERRSESERERERERERRQSTTRRGIQREEGEKALRFLKTAKRVLVLKAAATLVLSLSRGSSGTAKYRRRKRVGEGSFSDCLRTDSCPNLSQPWQDPPPRSWGIIPGSVAYE